MDSREYRLRVSRSVSERDFQAQVIKLATTLGWRHYHTHDSRRSPAGFPDLVLVNPARRRVMYRELKAERGRVSTMQQDWLGMLSACGVDAGVWRPSDLMSGLILSELQGKGEDK